MTAHAARATAKTAAATAKAAAKGVSATVKAMIASVKALVAAIAAGGWIAILAIVIICLIGLIVGSCFGIFFSGEDSGTGQTMPTVVWEINQEYEGKLEEIKSSTTHDALEMSGSRAVWPEVLAIYAVKTTTDPDNPQEVATMDDSKKELLKEIFWAMNEISSRTETVTTTQTVETDDGEGNIIEEEVEVTTTTLYITVTHKTVDEMADAYNFTADQRAQLAELLAEENRSMWSSALYGIGVGDGKIVVVALSQLGNVGGQPYWSWYGFNSRVEWCACFVSWCANECGYLDAGVIPRTAGCVTGSNWFKDRGLWQDNSYEPRPGDIIYFDWDEKGSSGPQDGLADHVGIVEKVENGMVYTIEGNSGDSCRENRYAIGHYEIYGYGTPAY
ncbi:CHAP domain-containing protein [Pseudoflavonifractor sp. 60]|nr:CHAP domain-containing protein [Pseudoflavonifractor sp. 60]